MAPVFEQILSPHKDMTCREAEWLHVIYSLLEQSSLKSSACYETSFVDSINQDLKIEMLLMTMQVPSWRRGLFLAEATLRMLRRSKCSVSFTSSDLPWSVSYSHDCCLSVLAWAGTASGIA